MATDWSTVDPNSELWTQQPVRRNANSPRLKSGHILPAIAGSAVVGATLKATFGEWYNSPTTYTAQFRRDGAAIPGAIDFTYVVTDADIGHAITVSVVALNEFGSNFATSLATALVADPDGPPPEPELTEPVNTTPPSVTGATNGTVRPGDILTLNTGLWTESPTSFNILWFAGTAATSATGLTYEVQAGDVGISLSARVIAVNAAGLSDPKLTTPILVLPFAPVNTEAPTILGVFKQGETLTANPGLWDNLPAFGFRWYIDDALRPDAISITYVPTEADVGGIPTVEVLATNAGGSASAFSAPGSPILPAQGDPPPVVIDPFDAPKLPARPRPDAVTRTLTGGVFVMPTAQGTASGADWANAKAFSQLPSIMATAGADKKIWLRADAGNYNATSLSFTAGGTVGHPVEICGVSEAGLEMDAVILGNRKTPWVDGGTTGQEVFRLLAGSGNIKFRWLRFQNLSTGIRACATVPNITIDACLAQNVSRMVEDSISGSETQAGYLNLVWTYCSIRGSTRGNRIQYSSTVTVSDIFIDLEGQNDTAGGLSVGIGFDGTASGTVKKCVSSGSLRLSAGVDTYVNGDAFSDELGNSIAWEDCVAFGCTDGGFDLKGTDTLLRCTAYNCKRNFRIWGTTTLTNCLGWDAFKRWGAYSYSVVWIGHAANVTFVDCGFAQLVLHSSECHLIEIERDATITLTNTSLQSPGETIFLTPGTGAAGVVVGSAVSPPTNTLQVSFTGTELALETLEGTAGNWTDSASNRRFNYVTDGTLYIPGAADLDFTLTKDEIGHVITLVEAAWNASYHLGLMASDPSGAIGGVSPSVLTDPTLTGFSMPTASLTRVPGTYQGAPVPSITGRWQTGATNTGPWFDVGSILPTLPVTTAMIGKYPSWVEQADNGLDPPVETRVVGSVVVSATPQTLFVKPVGTGTKTGLSFANAVGVESAQAAIENSPTGSTTNFQGVEYTLPTPITISTPGKTVRGVDLSMNPVKAIFNLGSGVDRAFNIAAGADNLTLMSMEIRNGLFGILVTDFSVITGLTLGKISYKDTASDPRALLDSSDPAFWAAKDAVLAASDAFADSVALQDYAVDFTDCTRGFDLGTYQEYDAFVSNANIIGGRHIRTGRGAIRIRGDSHNIWIQDVFCDAEYKVPGGSSIGIGIEINGYTDANGVLKAASDVVMLRCECNNYTDNFGSPTTKYRQGDGFSAELKNHHLWWVRPKASGCTDGGIDFKAQYPALVIGGVFDDNKRNIRTWGGRQAQPTEVIDCTSISPFSRGGTGGPDHLYINQNSWTRVYGLHAVGTGVGPFTRGPVEYAFGGADASPGVQGTVYFADENNETPVATPENANIIRFDWATSPVAATITTPGTAAAYTNLKFQQPLQASKPVDWLPLTGPDADLFTQSQVEVVSKVPFNPATPVDVGLNNVANYTLRARTHEKYWGAITSKNVAVTISAPPGPELRSMGADSAASAVHFAKAIFMPAGGYGDPVNGYVDGDIAILQFEGNSTPEVEPPAAWVLFASTTTPSVGRLYWRRISGPISGETITNRLDHIVFKVYVFKGCPTTGSPIDLVVATSLAAGTSLTVPGGTTTEADQAVLIFTTTSHDVVGNAAYPPIVDSYVNTSLTGLTELADTGTNSGNGGSLALGLGYKATPGVVSSTTIGLAVSEASWNAVVSLKKSGTIGAAPVFTAPPVITGTAQEGQTLSVTNGTATGSGVSFARNWRADGVSFSPAQTGTTLLLTPAMVGKVIDCSVVASNTAGTDTEVSAPTSAVLALASAFGIPSIVPAGYVERIRMDFKNTNVVSFVSAQTDDGIATDKGWLSPAGQYYRLPNAYGTSAFTAPGLIGYGFDACIDHRSPLLNAEYVIERPGGENVIIPGVGLRQYSRPAPNSASQTMLNTYFPNVRGATDAGVPIRCGALVSTYRKIACAPPFAISVWCRPNNDASELFFWDPLWTTQDGDHAWPNDQLTPALEIDGYDQLKAGPSDPGHEGGAGSPTINESWGTFIQDVRHKLLNIVLVFDVTQVRAYKSVDGEVFGAPFATRNVSGSLTSEKYNQKLTAWLSDYCGGMIWLGAAGAVPTGNVGYVDILQYSLYVPASNTNVTIPSGSLPGEVLVTWAAGFTGNIPVNTAVGTKVADLVFPSGVTSAQAITWANRLTVVGTELRIGAALNITQQPILRFHIEGFNASGNRSNGREWSKTVGAAA